MGHKAREVVSSLLRDFSFCSEHHGVSLEALEQGSEVICARDAHWKAVEELTKG